MAEMFDSDSENEFGGFEIWDVNAAEKKYLLLTLKIDVIIKKNGFILDIY
jgi:hypothetical protein